MVQVSMNLTNYQKTPIFRVFDTIKREAQRLGTSVYSSEIVGLTPMQALVDTADYYLQLEKFTAEQIIETHLMRLFQGTPPKPEKPATFFAEVASNAPAPGGGSVAAAAGAFGAALSSMVARLTLGKQKYRDVSEDMSTLLGQSEPLREKLTARIEEDAEAFQRVMDARALPRDNDEQKAVRQIAIDKANAYATEVPLQTMRDALAVLEQAYVAAGKGNPNSASDAGVAAIMAKAAVDGAWLNVLINLGGFADESKRNAIRTEGERLVSDAATLAERVLSTVHEKINA
jgi:glutamate formiminotransferase/formiminotetrahydrofolate cyclodeaminase